MEEEEDGGRLKTKRIKLRLRLDKDFLGQEGEKRGQ